MITFILVSTLNGDRVECSRATKSPTIGRQRPAVGVAKMIIPINTEMPAKIASLDNEEVQSTHSSSE